MPLPFACAEAAPFAQAFFMSEDYTAEIDYLEKLVNGAVTSTSTDGASTTFDLDHAKKRLSELRILQQSALVRPVAVRTLLGGSW